jgi:hypothetical protein
VIISEDKQCTYNVTLKRVRCCSGKATSITRSVGGFVAGIQHAMCACAILSSVACPAVQYFPRYPVNGKILGKTLLNINVFRVSLQLSSETFFVLRGTERDMIKRNFGLHVQYLYSCPILMKLRLP